MIKNKKAEVLAPAGSVESLTAAVRTGADAVYLGVKDFSARQNAANFDLDELEKAVFYCHKCGVKVYLAMNTILFDYQLGDAVKCIKSALFCGVDAFIIQDLSLIELIREVCPDAKLHASTQMTIHTKEGALFAKDNGFSRVVLAREMNKEQIKQIVDTGIETEVFVHGALCMSVSGQCFMSAMIGSRSANRGLCAQACRLPFSAVKGESRCDLSLKDMSHIKYLNELCQMGVTSFKIEGRMKRPEYVAAAVSACNDMLYHDAYNVKDLQDVFSRSGFTDGYYIGKHGKNMFGTRQKEDVVAAKDVLPSLALKYKKERKVSKINFDITIKKDEKVKLIACDEENNSVIVYGNNPEKAIYRPMDYEMVLKQISKLGDTIYEMGEFSCTIDDGLIISASELNNLRREAVSLLDKKRAKIKTTKYEINDIIVNIKHYHRDNLTVKTRISVSDIGQLKDINVNDFEYVILPYRQAENLDNSIVKDRFILNLPRYSIHEEEIISDLKRLYSLGFTNLMVNNIAHINFGKDIGFTLHGGYALNITNSYSLKFLKEHGVADSTLSFEMKFLQISKLGGDLKMGIIAYGKLPLMLTVNCPVKSAVGCHKCEKKLTDRTGRSFDVVCGSDCVEILNSDVLYLADKQQDITNIDFITLAFTDESSEMVKKVADCYKNGEKSPFNQITRGLYYRGIV